MCWYGVCGTGGGDDEDGDDDSDDNGMGESVQQRVLVQEASRTTIAVTRAGRSAGGTTGYASYRDMHLAGRKEIVRKEVARTIGDELMKDITISVGSA